MAGHAPHPLVNAPSEYFGPANFKWLLRGRLGGMPCPGVVRPIEVDLEAIQRLGLSLVVTLTDEWQPPVQLMRSFGLESLYCPIVDMSPPTHKQALETCEAVERVIRQGKSVVYHCHGGRGRTGTMLAAQLIMYSPDSAAAIARVKSVNQSWIETESQMKFLEAFSEERKAKIELEPKSSPGDMNAPRKEVRRWIFDGIFDGCNWLASSTFGRRNKSKDTQPPQGKEINMSLDKALQAAMGAVPECVASGYVDMETGMLMGVQTLDSHPQEVLDSLAAATADLFQGSNIVHIESLFKKARGTEKDDNHYFQEIIVFSENLLHVFMRAKKFPMHVCTFVCRKSANPGMVLTKARMSMDKVTAAF